MPNIHHPIHLVLQHLLNYQGGMVFWILTILCSSYEATGRSIPDTILSFVTTIQPAVLNIVHLSILVYVLQLYRLKYYHCVKVNMNMFDRHQYKRY